MLQAQQIKLSMNGIKMIRLKLGLNQQQVAEWLGVSRSLVTHYELESRSLPSHAVLRLARLEALVDSIQKEKMAGRFNTNEYKLTPERNARLQRSIKLNAAYCSRKAEKLRRDLEELRLAQAQTIEWLQTLGRLLSEHDPGAENMEKEWLQFQYNLALKKMERCDETEQLKIMIKLAPLEVMEKLNL